MRNDLYAPLPGRTMTTVRHVFSSPRTLEAEEGAGVQAATRGAVPDTATRRVLSGKAAKGKHYMQSCLNRCFS